MSIVTAQQLQKYMDLFRGIDVTFTKDVVKMLSFVSEGVFLKILGSQWPCVLYSSSLEGAKIILSIKPDQLEKLRQSSNLGALRYSFRNAEKSEPVTFFVNIRIKGFNRYNSQTQDLYFMTLEFTQQPPDFLIETMGRFLEMNVNSKKRKDERIAVNEQLIKKMGFASLTTVIAVDKIERKCLIRDVSFGGTKVLFPGVAKFVMGKSTLIKFVASESGHVLEIPGKIVRVEEVDGRKDITVAAVQYDENSVPMEYIRLINEFLKNVKKNDGESPSKAPDQR